MDCVAKGVYIQTLLKVNVIEIDVLSFYLSFRANPYTDWEDNMEIGQINSILFNYYYFKRWYVTIFTKTPIFSGI